VFVATEAEQERRNTQSAVDHDTQSLLKKVLAAWKELGAINREVARYSSYPKLKLFFYKKKSNLCVARNARASDAGHYCAAKWTAGSPRNHPNHFSPT
jgi:hypothetical protein